VSLSRQVQAYTLDSKQISSNKQQQAATSSNTTTNKSATQLTQLKNK